MKFSLPLPPPENERLIFAPNLGRFILGKKYRQYKHEAQAELIRLKLVHKFEMLKPSFGSQKQVFITVYLPDKRRDHHGMLKPLLDVMEGTIYDNDKWVCPVFLPADISQSNPRVEVEIE